MKKKKILILANDFPPYVSVGAMRPYGWAKYLPKDKWEVTVVTRHWDEDIQTAIDCVKNSSKQVVEVKLEEGYNVVRVPYKANLRDKLLIKFGFNKFSLFRKMLSFGIELFKFDFLIFDVLSGLYFESKKILSEESFDLIITTGEPFVLFKYAHLLSKRFDVPWVADYRDGWTTNQEQKAFSLQEKILNVLNKRKEKQYLKNVSLITTASPSYKEALSKITKKPIEVILNGFISSTNDLVQQKKTNQFVVSYVGTIYSHQNIELFAQGVLSFLFNNNISSRDVVIRFYGLKFSKEQKERVENAFKTFIEFLEMTPKYEYADYIEKISDSSLLVLISKKGMNWLNAKVYDYLLLNKPILFVGNDEGVLEDILKDCNVDYLSVNSEKEIEEGLKSYYTRFRSEGVLSSNNQLNKVLYYSRENQTGILSDKLHDLLIDS